MSTAYKPLRCGLNKFLRNILIKVTVVLQETDLLLIKCSYSDGKDAKVFQERAKIFGNKKVETIIGLQIQGPHAISKCTAVRSTIIKYRSMHCPLKTDRPKPYTE